MDSQGAGDGSVGLERVSPLGDDVGARVSEPRCGICEPVAPHPLGRGDTATRHAAWRATETIGTTGRRSVYIADLLATSRAIVASSRSTRAVAHRTLANVQDVTNRLVIPPAATDHT